MSIFYQIAGGADAFRTGTVLRISAGGERSYHKPTDNTDAARGDALRAANTAAQAGDQIHLVPGRNYGISTPISFNAYNMRLSAHDATITQLAAQDYCVSFNASDAGTHTQVDGLNVNVNGTAVTVTGAAGQRGEGVKLVGAGRVTLRNAYIYDAPKSDAGSCVRTYDAGKKTLENVTAENPGWACFHLRAYDNDVINCHARVSAAKAGATKQRWFDADAADFGHINIRGGSWWTDQAINAQSVFDPGSGRNASQVSVIGVNIDCGANATNYSTGEGVIKPDEVTQFVMSQCTQVQTGNRFVYLLWLGQACEHVSMGDVHASGIVHAGDSSSINIEECFIDRCSFGLGQTDAIKHAMTNVRAYRYLQLTNSKWYNLIGSGSQAAGLRGAFENLNASSDNFVRMKDCHFDSNWSETAYLFRTIPAIGYLGIDDITVNNRGSGMVAAPTPAQRLMIGSYADAFTARMAWRAIRNSTNLAPLSLTTWDHGHPQPSDTAAWATLVGPPGSRIRNVDPEGNSLQAYFNRDGSGDYV